MGMQSLYVTLPVLPKEKNVPQREHRFPMTKSARAPPTALEINCAGAKGFDVEAMCGDTLLLLQTKRLLKSQLTDAVFGQVITDVAAVLPQIDSKHPFTLGSNVVLGVVTTARFDGAAPEDELDKLRELMGLIEN